MSSNINPNNIDQDYPIAGQDNDSQGFRDNFTNIKTNFSYSKDEIEDLQSKVLLKSALLGGVLSNDLDGNIIKSALMQDTRAIVIDNGNAQGQVIIDVQEGSYYKLTSTGNMELDFINFPVAGTESTVYVEIEISDINHAVTLPVAADESAKGLQGYSSNYSNGIYYDRTGTYIYAFSSTDQGATLSVSELSRSRNDFYRTIATSVGSPGDAKGQIAFDGDYIYYCITDYNGIDDIWRRSLQSNTTW